MAVNKYRHERLLFVLCILVVRYFYLIYANKLLLFVHPRLHAFTYVMLALLIFIVIFLFVSKHRVSQYSLRGTCAVLLVILSLFPILGAQLNPGILPVLDANSLSSSDSSGDLGFADPDEADFFVAFDEEGRLLLTNTDTYYATLIELYENTSSYVGNTIESVGLVYKANNDADNEFGAGLYYMTCCAADAQLLGIKYVGTGSAPEKGERVSIEGTLDVDSFGDPFVSVSRITQTGALENPFMYY